MFKRHITTMAFIVGWIALLLIFAGMLRGIPIPILVMLSMPAITQWLLLIAQISYPQSDLTASGSGYSPFLLRLPMSTRSLALWPAVTSMAGSISMWLALGIGYYFRTGLAVPLGTTCGIAATSVGAVFVISWWPFHQGALRLISLAAALLTVVGLSIWLNPPVAAYFALAMIELLLSIRAARLARHSIRTASPSARSTEFKQDRPFTSSKEAMFWMEWRLRGRAFPITVAIFAAILTVPLAFMSGVPGELGHVPVNGWLPLGIPVLVLGTVGIGMLMRPDATLAVHDRSSFFLTLPVTNSEILNSKRNEQSAGVLAATAVVLVALLGWLLLPPEPLFALLRSGPKQLISTELVGVLLVGLLWRSRTIWTFASCCQDQTQSRVISMGAMGLPVVVALPVGLAWDSGVSLTGVLPLLPWALAALLLPRAWFAYRMGRQVAALSPIERTACNRLLARWTVTVICLWLLLLSLIALQPAEYQSLVSNPSLVTLLIAATAAPIVRPLLARQFLYSGRHG